VPRVAFAAALELVARHSGHCRYCCGRVLREDREREFARKDVEASSVQRQNAPVVPRSARGDESVRQPDSRVGVPR
jgi:hypothetical protein